MPPVTMTPQQFAAHPASRKPGASYVGYRRFIANRRAASGVAADPLAPTPEPQLRQQTTEAVRAQIDPILREITASTDRASKGVTSLTETYAGRLAPFADAAKERYGRAAESTAGVAESLANRLAGRGVEEGAGLKAKLAQINAPDRLTQEVAGGAQSFARGAANAGYGVDSAALDEILGQGATAEDFAGSLPGIARIAGVRAVGEVGREGQRQLGEVRGKIPGLVGNLMEGARDREVQKSTARVAREIGMQESAAEAKAAAASAQADAAKDADRSAQAWARIQQAGERIKLQGAKASFDQGIKNSKLDLDQKQYRLAMQKEARLAKGGGFTPATIQNLTEVSFDTAKAAYDDVFVLDSNGDPTTKAKPRPKPVEVLRVLIGRGIPFSIAVKAIQRVAQTQGADKYWKATLGWTK